MYCLGSTLTNCAFDFSFLSFVLFGRFVMPCHAMPPRATHCYAGDIARFYAFLKNVHSLVQMFSLRLHIAQLGSREFLFSSFFRLPLHRMNTMKAPKMNRITEAREKNEKWKKVQARLPTLYAIWAPCISTVTVAYFSHSTYSVLNSTLYVHLIGNGDVTLCCVESFIYTGRLLSPSILSLLSMGMRVIAIVHSSTIP